MNPLTNIKNLQKINERELELGIIGKKSWHDEFKDSAWLFIGGLPYDLSEGDIICVFSQYGEPVNFNLVRDHKTGKSKGFAFLCYEDQRSTILSVDNLNGIKILGRTIRVEHVKEYKIPKEHKEDTDFAIKMREYGCGPKVQSSSEEEIDDIIEQPKAKKDKKVSRKKKKKRRESSSSSSTSSSDDSENQSKKKIKKEKFKEQKYDASFIKREIKEEKPDSGYDKAANALKNSSSYQPKSEGVRSRNSERDLDRYKSKDGKRPRERSNDSRDRRRERSRSRERRRERSRSRERGNKGYNSRERKRERSDSRDRKRDRSYMNGRDR